MKYKFP